MGLFWVVGKEVANTFSIGNTYKGLQVWTKFQRRSEKVFFRNSGIEDTFSADFILYFCNLGSKVTLISIQT